MVYRNLLITSSLVHSESFIEKWEALYSFEARSLKEYIFSLLEIIIYEFVCNFLAISFQKRFNLQLLQKNLKIVLLPKRKKIWSKKKSSKIVLMTSNHLWLILLKKQQVLILIQVLKSPKNV